MIGLARSAPKVAVVASFSHLIDASCNDPFCAQLLGEAIVMRMAERQSREHGMEWGVETGGWASGVAALIGVAPVELFEWIDRSVSERLAAEPRR